MKKRKVLTSMAILIVLKYFILAVDIKKKKERTKNGVFFENSNGTTLRDLEKAVTTTLKSDNSDTLRSKLPTEIYTSIKAKPSTGLDFEFTTPTGRAQIEHFNATRIKTTKRIENMTLYDIQIQDDTTDSISTFASDTPKHAASDIQEDVCSQYGGCELVEDPYWYCQCDEICEEFNDCCPEYNFTNTRRSNNKYSCVGIEDSVKNLWGVQSISNCPSAFKNVSIIAKCSNGLMKDTGPPVLSLHDNSLVYRNKYCALCNGVSAEVIDVVFTADSFVSDFIDQLSNMTDVDVQEYLFEKCSYRLLIPDGARLRYCMVGFVQNDDFLCHRYSNPVWYAEENKYYRNNFCRDIKDKTFGICLQDILPSLIMRNYGASLFQLNKLSILFSFRKTTYKMNQNQCKTWNEKNDKLCEHLPKFINALIDVEFNIKLPENGNPTMKEIFQAVLLTSKVKSVDGFTHTSWKFELKFDEKPMFINIKTKCTILKKIFSNEMSDIRQKIENQKVSIIETNNHGRKFETFILQNSDTLNMSYKNYILPYANSIDSLYSYFDIKTPNITFSKLCNDVEILVNRGNGQSLSVISFNCKAILFNQNKSSFLSILTYTLSSVSCFSLVVMVVVNRRRSFHLEIPFANLENVAISMVISNILLMIGNVAAHISNWLCYVISVISHYLWLAAFSFTSLAVFHIVKTLMQLKGRQTITKENKARKRRTMRVVGLIIPFLFVVPAIVVDQYAPNYYSPGYASNNVCFPTKFPGNLIFFMCPVLALIIFNTASIVQIIVKIRMATISRGNMRKTSSFSEAKVFLRILAISGWLWLTGILATYFEFEWLEYVFTILCGSQGVFVAIANLTTRRMNCCKGEER